MKAGISGLESFRSELGRLGIDWRVVESISALRNSVGLFCGITVWPLVSFALLPFVYGSSGAMTEGIEEERRSWVFASSLRLTMMVYSSSESPASQGLGGRVESGRNWGGG